jgi:hypothetical protein
MKFMLYFFFVIAYSNGILLLNVTVPYGNPVRLEMLGTWLHKGAR